MPAFRLRVLYSAVAVFVLITIVSWQRGLSPSRLPLPHLHSKPAYSAIDHIKRPKDGDGTLPRYWSVSDDHRLPGEVDIDETPPGVRKIMGLVFFGRRNTISILDCYLKVSNILEEIQRALSSLTLDFL